MNKLFAEDFARETDIRNAYQKAKSCSDEAGMEKARQDMQNLRDEQNARPHHYLRFYWFLMDMKERKETRLVLGRDSLPTDAIPDLVEDFKAWGITEFAFASGWTNTLEIAWAFQEAGFQMEGMIRVREANLWDDEPERTLPALLFKLKK